MSSEETISKPGIHPTANSSKFRLWTILLGVALVLFPVAQIFLLIEPWLALSEFIPVSSLIDLMSEALWASQSILLTILLMMLGGFAWIANFKRTGWVLAVSTTCVNSLQFLLASLGAIVAMLQNPNAQAMSWSLVSEFLEMTHYIPVFFTVFSIVTPVILLRAKVRNATGIQKREWWITLGVFAFLLLDIAFAFVTLYFGNQE